VKKVWNMKRVHGEEGLNWDHYIRGEKNEKIISSVAGRDVSDSNDSF